jgi:hypothetical protein
MKSNNLMVNHVTYVILKLTAEQPPYHILADGPVDQAAVLEFAEQVAARPRRVAGMVAALSRQNFAMTFSKDHIYAHSTEIGAQAAKKYLLEQGYQDHEFEIFLEYTRSWGIM